MAEIRNYTMNFSFGRPTKNALGLTSLRELTCTEVHGERDLNKFQLRGKVSG